VEVGVFFCVGVVWIRGGVCGGGGGGGGGGDLHVFVKVTDVFQLKKCRTVVHLFLVMASEFHAKLNFIFCTV